MLEVLDPEQNNSFQDHYLEVDYDLSDVMFVTTANTLRMPQPLLDRMEVIRLSGYTEDEKVEIATKHLIKKQHDQHGLKEGEWQITESGLRDLIRYYTREAGVRNLEREIANLARKAVKEILIDNITKIEVNPENLEKYAGVRKYRFGEVEESDLIGATDVAEILNIKLDRVRYLSRLNRIPSRTLGKMGTRIYSKKQIEKIKESNIQL